MSTVPYSQPYYGVVGEQEHGVCRSQVLLELDSAGPLGQNSGVWAPTQSGLILIWSSPENSVDCQNDFSLK